MSAMPEEVPEAVTCQGPYCSNPVRERSPYCSSACRRRAKKHRSRAREQIFTCPACEKVKPIPVHTMAGMVCTDCAPFDSCDKLTYTTFEAADWARRALEIRRTSGERRFRPLRVYFHRECGNWHLTSQLS